MAVRPFTWVSWSEARSRMPEIWNGWQWDRYHADKAMVNSLRRGKVPYRGEAHNNFWSTPVRLEDVVPNLLSVNSFSAEYEQEISSPGFKRGSIQMPPRRMRQTQTVTLFGVELAWEEFRDDLIRYELPVGVTVDDSDRPQPQTQRRGEYLPWLEAFLDKLPLDTAMSDDAIAGRFIAHIERLRAANKSVPGRIPQRRNIAVQVSKLWPQIRARRSRLPPNST